jgi:hypothetical protein
MLYPAELRGLLVKSIAYETSIPLLYHLDIIRLPGRTAYADAVLPFRKAMSSLAATSFCNVLVT